jgi:hypothetical protein
MQADRILVTSALSRYSRNSEKLHRILEYLLAHSATVLTTNYLIRSSDVWVRRGDLVKPDSKALRRAHPDSRVGRRAHTANLPKRLPVSSLDELAERGRNLCPDIQRLAAGAWPG